jgi:signal transduction histidine kinase
MPMLRSMRQAVGHLDPLLIDGMVALILFAFMAVQFIGTRHLQTGLHPTTPLTWVLAVLIVAPILTHRRFPRASLAVCLTALLAYAAGRYVAYPGLPVFVLTFDIALHSRRRVGLAALVASAAAIAFSLALQSSGVVTFSTWVASELGVLVAWLAGRNLRLRRARWAELQARTERLEREREEEARRAVTEERLRIARELHDVIAHSMSVIAVQSAVGNHVIDAQPAEARQALAAIEATSRSALTEMRRLLGVLRQEGEPRGSLSPAPGLADLSSLVSQVQDAGLQVWINVDGQRGSVPPGIDLSAYRVIQEALTNVIKHAGSAAATVTIRYRDDSVTVEIANQAPAASVAHVPAPRMGSGHGIIGMRERVAVFGGQFAAGSGPDGGFLVRACFPIAAVTG